MRLEIKQGILEGGEEKSLTTGKVFYTFMGIPYGEPPVGELRFRPPRPAGKWAGVRNAKLEPEWCIQELLVGPGEIIGSEDCLNINVLIPEPPNADAPLKPVMVHVHGGGFIYGSGALRVASYDHLVNYDVIMVTFSYRLHILGYLNLNTPSCTGNCGPKDQILALKWVQENIQAFGGDPNNVTLFGESAGAASVHLLAISPLAKGLFHKVIVQSGHAFAKWVLQENQVDVGLEIGHRLGFVGTDLADLANFLREQPVEILLKECWRAVRTFKQENPFDTKLIEFMPSIERFVEDAFLPCHPKNLLEAANPVPTIMGVAEREGVLILMDSDDHSVLDVLKDDLSEVVKQNLMTSDPCKVQEAATALKEFYLSTTNETENNGHRSRIIDLFSDVFNLHLYDSFSHVIQSNMPLYVYQFTYFGNLNESKFWGMNVSGSLHADESNYIVLSRGFFPNPNMNDQDRVVSHNLCTLWTNFAKTGNPNPIPYDAGDEWTPHTEENPCYLRIEEKLSHQTGKLYEKGSALWKMLYQKYSDSD